MKIEVVAAGLNKATNNSLYGDNATDVLYLALEAAITAELNRVQSGQNQHVVAAYSCAAAVRYLILYNHLRGDSSGVYIWDAAPIAAKLAVAATKLEIGWWISPAGVVHVKVAALRFVH